MRAVLDSSLFGERVIVTRTLDGADPTTKYKPATLCADCQRQDGSNLETILTTNLQVMFIKTNYSFNYMMYVLLMGLFYVRQF